MDRSHESQEWSTIVDELDSRTDEAIKRLFENEEGAVDTAQSIAQIYEPYIKSEYGRRSLDQLFINISGEATNYDDIRAKRLAELVVALHGLPDCRTADGETMMIAGEVVWRDLPQWSYNFGQWSLPIESVYPSHDAVGPRSVFTDTRREGNPDIARDMLNASTFGAYLLANLPAGEFDECGGMADYASIALDMALERTHVTEGDVDAAAPWRLLVLPATAWILIAGAKLHELCHHDIPEASTIYLAMSREWPRKFCPERWSFWKQALRQLEAPLGLEERYQGVALDAAKRMDELD